MINRYPTKPCRHCDKTGHYPYQCRYNPKIKKYINKSGKHTTQWLNTRAVWIRKNPPSFDGYWLCYLRIHPSCPKFIDIHSLTVDHVIARSKDPSKRYDLSNLKPACYFCNEMKGSRKLDEVL